MLSDALKWSCFYLAQFKFGLRVIYQITNIQFSFLNTDKYEVKHYILIIFLIFNFFELSFACDDKLKPFKVECRIQDEYRELRSFYESRGLDIENITGYKSLRFIKKEHWYARKNDFQCHPWEFHNPKPKKWLYWERGNFLVKKLYQEILVKNDKLLIDKDLVEVLHLGTFDSSLKSSTDKGSRGNPTQIRSKSWRPSKPKFKVKCEDYEIDSETLTFLKDYDLKDSAGKPLVKLAPFSSSCNFTTNGTTEKFHGATITHSNSFDVKKELQALLEFTNRQLKLIEDKKSNISPLEFIADVQRWYVSIYPFGAGNDKTSRYLQDLLLNHFDLPFQRTGFLGEGILSNKGEYREKSILNAEETISFLKKCQKDYEEGKRFDQLSCECRPLYSSKKFGAEKVLVEDNKQKEKKCFEGEIKEPVDDIKDFEQLTLWLINNNWYGKKDN